MQRYARIAGGWQQKGDKMAEIFRRMHIMLQKAVQNLSGKRKKKLEGATSKHRNTCKFGRIPNKIPGETSNDTKRGAKGQQEDEKAKKKLQGKGINQVLLLKSSMSKLSRSTLLVENA